MAKQQQSDQEKAKARAQKKSDNFVKLAQKRMTKALHALANVERLANRNSYTYDSAQTGKMVAALANACKRIDERFKAPTTAKAEGGFTF